MLVAPVNTKALFLGYVAAVFLAAAAGAESPVPVYRWSTLSGWARFGSNDGPATMARFNQPTGLATDVAGNVYVADTENSTIRKIGIDGRVSTLAGLAGEAGSVDGVGGVARFRFPRSLAVDAVGNIYVADSGNNTVRRVAPDGVVTTLAGQAGTSGDADGPATAARFQHLSSIAVDAGGILYVGDNNGLRQIDHGNVKTLFKAGATMTSGPETFTVFPATWGPTTLGIDLLGRLAFAATVTKGDRRGFAVVELGSGGQLVPLVNELGALGDRRTWSGLTNIEPTSFGGFTIDRAGYMYLSAKNSYWVESPGPPVVIVRLGPDGVPLSFRSVVGDDNRLHPFAGMTTTVAGDLVITCEDSNVVSLYPANNSSGPSVLAGRPIYGNGSESSFQSILDLAIDPGTNTLWLADQGVSTRYAWGVGQTWSTVSPDGVVTSQGVPMSAPYEYISFSFLGLTVDPLGNAYLGSTEFGSSGSNWVRVSLNSIGTPTPIPALDKIAGLRNLAAAAGGRVYICTSTALHLLGPDNTLSLLAGSDAQAGTVDGVGVAARFNSLSCPVVDAAGNCYLLDSWGYEIGTPTVAGTTTIRRITPAGVVTTVSGNLMREPMVDGYLLPAGPSGLALGPAGEFYFCYGGDATVWRLDVDGTQTLLGGSSAHSGNVEGIGAGARFYFPWGVVVDANKNLYLVDQDSQTIRKGTYLGTTPVVLASPSSQTVTAGVAVQFSVQVAGSPAPTCQWYFGEVALAGATGTSLRIASAQASDAGIYTVVVANTAGTATSPGATLTVNPVPVKPVTTAGGGGGGGAPSIGCILSFALLSGLRWLFPRNRPAR